MCREPLYITREQFLDMTDWELINVYLRPSKNESKPEEGYWPVARFDPKDPPVRDITIRELFFDPRRVEKMRVLGMSEAEMEEAFQKWSKSCTHGRSD